MLLNYFNSSCHSSFQNNYNKRILNMFKLFLLPVFLLSEISADLQADSEIIYKHEYKRSIGEFYSESEHPFTDLTEAINQKNLLKIEKTLNVTSKVHYSTNQLISEIANISWVANLLSDIYDSNPPENNASLGLSLSFQITKNRSNIDWRYITDVLNGHNPNSEDNINEHLNVESFGQYLCQVILDFRVDEPLNIEYQRSQAYAKRWDISFTKYAKLILKNIFTENKTFAVGVMYTESQVRMQDSVLLDQEIKHADYAIVNVNYFPLTRVPLDSYVFMKYLSDLRYKNRDYWRSGLRNTTQRLEIPLKYMLTWNEYKPCAKLDCPTSIAEDQVYRASQSIYRELFIDHVHTEMMFGRIGIISGVQLDTEKRRWMEYTLRHTNYDHTYLHVQESDVTACRLGKLLVDIKDHFNDVAVNEYTWNAFANFHGQITNGEYMATQCGNDTIRRLSLPENFLLFASTGIGAIWNQTGSAFTDLLERSQHLRNLTISTIVFSSDDLNSGTNKLIRQQSEANSTKIGCMVDLTSLMIHGTASPQNIIQFVQQKCELVLSESSLLVWKIQIDNQTNDIHEFTYNLEKNSLKSNLIKMLIAKELYKSINPTQEVMFRVKKAEENRGSLSYKRNGTGCFTFTNHLQSKYLDIDLMKWGALHKVKIIPMMPAFDLKTPLMGFIPFSFEESNENKYKNCY